MQLCIFFLYLILLHFHFNEPKTFSQSSSFERRRMSKRLAEDAKAYFDECVSLSTFDSSDFSSQEDPSLNLVGPPTPSGIHVCLTEASPHASVCTFITFLND